MAGKKRYNEFRRYPKYEQLYLHAFDRMLEARRAADMNDKWQAARDVFRWWLEEDYTQYELSDEVWRKNDE